MKQPKNKDPYYRLKFMGYCLSQMPPEGVKIEFEDFVNYAKFQLCRESNRLMKDPIWEDYLPEEILIEYYARLYDKNEDERTKMEAIFAGQDPEVVDWFDSMIEKNKQELDKIKETLGETEDEVSFSPESLGD